MENLSKNDILFCDIEIEVETISKSGKKTTKKEQLENVVYKVGNKYYKNKKFVRVIKVHKKLGKSVVDEN